MAKQFLSQEEIKCVLIVIVPLINVKGCMKVGKMYAGVFYYAACVNSFASFVPRQSSWSDHE